MFGRKLSIGQDLYGKLKKCSEPAGYATPEEFALHVLEREVDRILTGGGESGGETGEEIIKKHVQRLGYID